MVMLFIAALELLEIACKSADVKGQLTKFAVNSLGVTPQPGLTLSWPVFSRILILGFGGFFSAFFLLL